jgi:hypothetical protein
MLHRGKSGAEALVATVDGSDEAGRNSNGRMTKFETNPKMGSSNATRKSPFISLVANANFDLGSNFGMRISNFINEFLLGSWRLDASWPLALA